MRGRYPDWDSDTRGAEDPDLVEPDWREFFQVTRGPQAKANRRAREVARSKWREIVPKLTQLELLLSIDQGVLEEFCVCVARIDELNRLLSREGWTTLSTRGTLTRHPASVTLNQYRRDLRHLSAALGLSPIDRLRLPVIPSGPREDSLWD